MAQVTRHFDVLSRLRAVKQHLTDRIAENSWHVSQEGRDCARQLLALRGLYKNARCFVIGNGPSLTLDDLGALQDEITIASNGIFLAFPDTPFRPTFYTVEDHLVAEDRCREINAIERSQKVIPVDLRSHIVPSENTTYVWFRRHYSNFPRFALDLCKGAYFGGTVTYLNLQLAFHLGCSEVYLIGVDHNYIVPREGELVITSTGPDVNHFHPDYFGRGYRWHDPQVARMEIAYREACAVFESHHRTILNATRGGCLTVFPRASLDAVLSTGTSQ